MLEDYLNSAYNQLSYAIGEIHEIASTDENFTEYTLIGRLNACQEIIEHILEELLDEE